MSKDIVGFLCNLEAISEFFKQQQEDEEEFSQYGEKIPCGAERYRFIHNEDDSVVVQMRGY